MRLWIVFAAVAAFAQERADLLLRNGKVFDPGSGAVTQALVIRDGKIIATGSNDLATKYKAAKVIDLHGSLAIPGFDDTHIHLSGDAPHYVELAEAKSIQEIRRLVSAKAAQIGKGAWITGYGWSEDQLEEKRKPARLDLDAAAPSNPVVLTRAGGHSVTTNSRALELAKIDRTTPDPDKGVIEHDDHGEPTGLVRERGDLFTRFVPPSTPGELRASLINKLKALFAKGITSIIVAGVTPVQYAEWERIYAQNPDLPRAALQIRYTDPETLKTFGKKTGDGNERLRVGAIKIFVDGGFTGPAAYTIQPYKNQGDYRGKLTMHEAQLYEQLRNAHRLGWQLGLHTIGDGAIQLAVDSLAKILLETPRADHRHYLNHFSMTPPEATYRKMKASDIWLAQQPNFTYTLEGRYRDNLDDARLQFNNPLATPMNRYGIFTSLSSDILPIGPAIGLYAAVTRKGVSGAVYGLEARISIRQAIQAYTQNGAYFTREEKIKGTLAAGMLADLTVFEEDLLTADPAKILTAKPSKTILNGRVVYEKK